MAETKEDFWSRYTKLCLTNKIYPSRSIIKNLKSTDLSCIVESVRSEHWKFIHLALSKDNGLTKVHFASNVLPHDDEDDLAPENVGFKLIPVPASQAECQTELCIGCYSPAVYRGFIPVVDIQADLEKECQYFPTPYGRTPKNLNNIALSVSSLLQFSQTLTTLKLENLPLKIVDAENIASGVSESSPLKYFSLSGCNFEDGSIPKICKKLNVTGVSWIDFSFCALNLTDIEAVANVIKAHCVRRRNEMFEKTLRNQVPYLQDMRGLNRITLSCNALEDQAQRFLIESLTDDLWVKALDLQNCDIDNAGAVALLNLASTNSSIVIIDLRMNQIDGSLLSQLAKQLGKNKADSEVKCSELPLWRPSELVRKYNNIGKVKPFKKPAAHKLKISKRVTKRYTYTKSSQSTNERNYTTRDGFRDAASQTPAESADATEKKLRRHLQNEMKIRKFLVSKYRQMNFENAHLRQMLKSQNDEIYIDQETFFDVKHTFEKLKVFFDVMKKYGLWEYITLLGFDESTDVVLEDSISQKCMKIIRDETYAAIESAVEFEREVCCTCRKLDYKHKKIEPPDEDYNCIAGTSGSSHQILNFRPTSGRMPDNANSPQNSIKPLGNKQSSSAFPNTTIGAQMLIKKSENSGAPKQLKDLVSPTEFYKLVKKELEMCETKAKKPYNSIPTHSNETSSSAQVNVNQSMQNSYRMPKYRNEVNAASTSERRGSSTRLHSKIPDDDDDDDDIPISQLIAREKAAKLSLAKKDLKSFVSSSSNSNKVHKNTNRAKIKETMSLSKSEEMLSQSKLKLSSSQTNSKKVQSKYNASSDEINSSDSNITASDKISSRSSISSSSSNKSHGKLSDVTDASTFGEIESIIDTEVDSEMFLPVGNLNEQFKPSQDTVTSGPPSSHSSTLKDASESKSNKSNGCKSNKSAISGSSSIKDPSKKSDNSVKTNTQSQGKTKNNNKNNKKNRPKSNSSKSSSVPSLEDITTISSKSLNTDSVMNQISCSEDDKPKRKK